MTKILNPIELRRERIAKPRPVCLAACTPTLLLCKSIFLTTKLKLLNKKKSSLIDAGTSFTPLFCISITNFISIFLRLERRRKGTRPAWPASLTKASPQTMSSENRKLVRIRGGCPHWFWMSNVCERHHGKLIFVIKKLNFNT